MITEEHVVVYCQYIRIKLQHFVLLKCKIETRHHPTIHTVYCVHITTMFVYLIINDIYDCCSQYQELMQLGVSDRAQVYSAFLVYLDLTEG